MNDFSQSQFSVWTIFLSTCCFPKCFSSTADSFLVWLFFNVCLFSQFVLFEKDIDFDFFAYNLYEHMYFCSILFFSRTWVLYLLLNFVVRKKQNFVCPHSFSVFSSTFIVFLWFLDTYLQQFKQCPFMFLSFKESFCALDLFMGGFWKRSSFERRITSNNFVDQRTFASALYVK